MSTVRVFTRHGQLDELAAPWQAVAEASPGASVFQTWQWQRAWWRHLSRGAQPLILLVEKGGAPIGIAPLARKAIAGLPLRRLQFSGTGVSDYLDFLFLPSAEEEFWQAVSEALARLRGSWDLLDLHQIPEGSATLWGLPAACARLGWRSELLPQEVCPGLQLPSSWERLLASFNKKSRFRVKYYRRLAERELSSSWRIVEGQQEAAAAMEQLFTLHAARWRSRGLPGMLFEERRRRFHREIALSFADKGWLKLYLAGDEGAAAAALYCFDYKNVVYYYLGGFHPGYARYSLGTVLVGRAIEKAIEAGRSRFDFLRGAEPYKYQWGARDQLNRCLRVIPPGLGPRCAAGFARSGQALEKRLKQSFQKWLLRRRPRKEGR